MSGWAEKNRAYFDDAASSYNTKFSKTILQIIKEIQERRDWIGVDWIEDDSSTSTSASSENRVTLLDYACGTGLISRALAPFVTQSIGIDLSDSMVKEYNTGAMNQGIPESEMKAFVGNLIDISDPSPSAFTGPSFFNFDVAAVGMGWHHFDDPPLAAKRLAERLKPGGVLFIIDFLPHEHFHGKMSDHPAAETVTHMGFSEEDTRQMFVDAGVGNGFEYLVLGKGVSFTNKGDEIKRSVFMARGVKG